MRQECCIGLRLPVQLRANNHKESGPWLKTIEFKLLIIKKFTLSLENDTQNENILLLSK